MTSHTRSPTSVSATILDLFSGIGGLSLGFKMVDPNVRTIGMESDPLAVAIYRHRVGTCGHVVISDETAPPLNRATFVVADPPSKAPRGAAGINGAFDRAHYLNAIRMAVQTDSRGLLLTANPGRAASFARGVFPHHQWIESTMKEAGFRVEKEILSFHHYGVPHERRRVIFVGFRSKRELSRFEWPAPPDPPTYVSLSAVIPELPFTRACPPLTESENKSQRIGNLRASEVIRSQITSLWPYPTLALPIDVISTIQGFEDWSWDQIAKEKAYKLLGGAFDPRISSLLAAAMFAAIR